MKQGIIFDLDGVLLSTDEMHYTAWKTIADELQIPFGREENNLLRGVSRMASLEIILNLGKVSLAEEEKQALAEKKNSRYVALLQSLTPNPDHQTKSSSVAGCRLWKYFRVSSINVSSRFISTCFFTLLAVSA